MANSKDFIYSFAKFARKVMYRTIEIFNQVEFGLATPLKLYWGAFV